MAIKLSYDKRELPIVKDRWNSLVTSEVKRKKHREDVTITKYEEFVRLNTQFHRVCQIR
jgi:hypothetical protein